MQGYILGLIFFVLHINDLYANLRTSDVNCYLFADDLGLGLNVRIVEISGYNCAVKPKMGHNQIIIVANSVCSGLFMLSVLKDCVYWGSWHCLLCTHSKPLELYGISLWGDSFIVNKLFVLQNEPLEQDVVSQL